MNIHTKNNNIYTVVIVVILILAIAIRLWGIKFGLPFIYHPDESRYLISAQLLFKTHNLDPLSLPDISSSAFVYVINALAYLPYFLIGKLKGVFITPLDIPAPVILGMGVGKTSMPSTFLLGRLVTLLFGTMNVYLVYVIGKKVFKSASIGLMAALFIAISPTNVTNSRYITPDTFVVFFVLLAFLGTILVYENDRLTSYLLCGLALGCVASTKISGILIIVPLVIIYFVRHGKRGLFNLKIYLLFITALITFALTTPYVFINLRDVLNDIALEGRHYSQGHAGMEGNTFQWYFTFMWGTSGLLYLFSLFEILRGLLSRSKEVGFVSIFPVAYFVFISYFLVRNDRTFLPATPFLFLLAASFLIYLVNQALKLRPGLYRKLAMGIVLILTVGAMVQPTLQTFENIIVITTKDSRETARVWIEKNLPKGSKIAFESYSPFIDPKEYSLQYVGRMIDYPPEWYADHGFDYLVFSEGMYMRFFREPEKYRTEVSSYNQLFKMYHPLMLFTDGGYEVRVYKIKPPHQQ